MKFQIRYAGISNCENNEWENCDANTLDKAETIAWEMACQDYEMYEGHHGIRGIYELMEEEGYTEEEAIEAYPEERGNWLSYEAREKL